MRKEARMDKRIKLRLLSLSRKFAIDLFNTLNPEGDELSAKDIAYMALRSVHPVFHVVELMKTHGLTVEKSEEAADKLLGFVEDERIVDELTAIIKNSEYKVHDIAYAMLAGFIAVTFADALNGTEKIGGENEADK